MLKAVSKYVFSAFMIGAGILHFVSPEFYLRIMPPYLPWHLELVYLSGVCESALGLLLLVPRFSRWAAWGLIALFVAIAYAGFRLAMNTQDLFVRYATAGVIIWLMAHVMINIGMVLALLPVIGIPLPLVSYGGSSLVTQIVALGLVVGFARSEPEAASALRDKRRARKRGTTGFDARRGINAGARPRSRT